MDEQDNGITEEITDGGAAGPFTPGAACRTLVRVEDCQWGRSNSLLGKTRGQSQFVVEEPVMTFNRADAAVESHADFHM